MSHRHGSLSLTPDQSDQPITDKDKLAAFPLLREEYCCPQCESLIRLERIVYASQHRSSSLSRQAETICEVCNSAWRAHQILVDGVYRTAQIDRVTAAKETAAIQRKIDIKMGVTQLSAA